MKFILKLLQRLWLYKTLANTSDMLTFLGSIGKKKHADPLFVCCVRDRNVAGLDNVVSSKMDLRTVGVGDVPETG